MTTKGDKVSTMASTADDAYLDIKPSSGEEWSVHNICWGGAAELYFSDGTHNILVGSSESAGGRLGQYLNCTNTYYYRLRNVNGDTQYLGYDGVVTKIAT